MGHVSHEEGKPKPELNLVLEICSLLSRMDFTIAIQGFGFKVSIQTSKVRIIDPSEACHPNHEADQPIGYQSH